jgi:ParB-like chromosome segregation protein Spo0J
MKLALEKIKIDGGTQARAALNEDVVAEYAEAIIAGADMPPVTVFHDGKAYWLADGFHRFHAHRKARAIEIDADVRTGTKRDAKWFSLGANQAHGLRRSNEDKRCAVRDALRDREWSKLSDRELAAHIGVSHSFVAAVRDPDKAARQQANRDASAARRVESDSTDGLQTAPQSHSFGSTEPPPGENAPLAEHQPPAAPKSHSGAASDLGDAGKSPVSAPADQQHPAADDETDQLIDELQADNTRLVELLKAAEADDLKAEAIKWRRCYDNAQRQQAEAMDAASRSEKREKETKNLLMRCGRAVGVEDPRKIPAAVEALARSKAAA